MTGRRGLLAAGAALLAPAAGAQTGDWPARPLRMIVPFAPGGATDRVGRMLAEPLGRALGQPVVVENRGGAGGTPAALAALAAPPDGYTLFLGAPGQMVFNPILMRDLPYDPLRDFQPVSQIYRSAYAIAVHPSLPVRSVAELIGLAKETPGRLAYATAGTGTGPHLAGEMLASMTGGRLSHVPYRGSALAIQDVLAGHVPVSIDSLDILLPQVRGGALRGIAVTSQDRNPLFPELPAVAETLPGYDVTAFVSVVVRAGTPRPIVERLSRAVDAIVRAPAFAGPNAAVGAIAVGGTPEQLGQVIAAELARWRPVIAAAGIRIE